MLGSNRKQALPQNSTVPGFEFRHSHTSPALSSVPPWTVFTNIALEPLYLIYWLPYCTWASVHTCCQLRRCFVDTILLYKHRDVCLSSVARQWGRITQQIKVSSFFFMAAFLWASPSSPVSSLLPLGSHFSVLVSSPGSSVVPWGSSLAQQGFWAPSSHCTYTDRASCWHQWLCSETAQAAPPASLLDQSPECMDK